MQIAIYIYIYKLTRSDSTNAGMISVSESGEKMPQKIMVTTDSTKKSFGVYSYLGGFCATTVGACMHA